MLSETGVMFARNYLVVAAKKKFSARPLQIMCRFWSESDVLGSISHVTHINVRLLSSEHKNKTDKLYENVSSNLSFQGKFNGLKT